MSSTGLSAPVPLSRSHKRDEFDCGSPPLNDYRSRFAWTKDRSRINCPIVAFRSAKVAFFRGAKDDTNKSNGSNRDYSLVEFGTVEVVDGKAVAVILPKTQRKSAATR